jgi:predicted SAM-dependent methyltransferase
VAERILEVGGGLNPQPFSTVRLDVRNIPNKVDVVRNADDLSCFKDGEFDGLFARHIIEHFSWRNSVRVLKEWGRVVKQSGWMEIHCPDLDKIYSAYHRGCIDPYTNKMFTYNSLVKYLYGGQEYPENTHIAGFTYSLMVECLNRVGFTKVERKVNLEDFIEMKIVARR